MKHIIKLTEEDACAVLKQITEAEKEAWDIHFVENEGHIRLDEEKPIVCDGLSLELFVEHKTDFPECSIPNCEIIGIFGDDEFAWVCRKDDGSIVEVDEYDLRNGALGSGMIFPSLSHYLLFVLNYQG